MIVNNATILLLMFFIVVFNPNIIEMLDFSYITTRLCESLHSLMLLALCPSVIIKLSFFYLCYLPTFHFDWFFFLLFQSLISYIFALEVVRADTFTSTGLMTTRFWHWTTLDETYSRLLWKDWWCHHFEIIWSWKNYF